jgi:putative ABC transport system permease protein
MDVRPDWRVVGLTFATSIATALALAFGLFPAVRGTRLPPAESLKAQSRSVIGAAGYGGGVPVGKLLIAGQMAFAILFLPGGAFRTVLAILSLLPMSDLDLGLGLYYRG